MPLICCHGHTRDFVSDQVSFKTHGVIKQAIPFNPLPSIHVPYKSGRFIVEEYNFLFHLSSSGMDDFNHMKETNQVPSRPFPYTETTCVGGNHVTLDWERQG